MTKYSFTQLQDLWKQAGGNPASAVIAAAIAMAESGGDSNATNSNSNGTTDRGLWQINSIHGGLSTFDVTANTKAAVQLSQNGTTWRPWCTAWSSGRCSGTYLGSGAPYQKFMGGATSSSTTAPTFQNVQDPTGISSLTDPSSWAKAFLSPIAVWAFYGLMVSGGILLTGVGMAILLWESKPVQTAKNIVIGYASKGTVKPKSAESKSDNSESDEEE